MLITGVLDKSSIKRALENTLQDVVVAIMRWLQQFAVSEYKPMLSPCYDQVRHHKHMLRTGKSCMRSAKP